MGWVIAGESGKPAGRLWNLLHVDSKGRYPAMAATDRQSDVGHVLFVAPNRDRQFLAEDELAACPKLGIDAGHGGLIGGADGKRTGGEVAAARWAEGEVADGGGACGDGLPSFVAHLLFGGVATVAAIVKAHAF